jgi:hypothetical protein
MSKHENATRNTAVVEQWSKIEQITGNVSDQLSASAVSERTSLTSLSANARSLMKENIKSPLGCKVEIYSVTLTHFGVRQHAATPGADTVCSQSAWRMSALIECMFRLRPVHWRENSGWLDLDWPLMLQQWRRTLHVTAHFWYLHHIRFFDMYLFGYLLNDTLCSA